MRRAHTVEADTEAPDRVEVGDVALDMVRHELVINGGRHMIPPREFDLLYMLMTHAGRTLTRDQLITRVWGADYVGDTKTLDVHIKRVRARVEETPSDPVRVVTVRGVGYRYERG